MLWYAAGLVVAVAIAWLAAVLHISGHAPIGLFSVGVGVVLGAMLSAIAASGHRPKGGRLAGRRLLIGTIFLALFTVLAEHAWLYHDFRRQWHEARATSAEVAMFRSEAPWSPSEYFRRELTPQRAALWCLDAALIITAAVAIMLILERKRQ
jgi:hypothetical protein